MTPTCSNCGLEKPDIHNRWHINGRHHPGLLCSDCAQALVLSDVADMLPARRPLPRLIAAGPAEGQLRQAIDRANALRQQIENVKQRIRGIEHTPKAQREERRTAWFAEGETLFQEWKKLYLEVKPYVVTSL